MMGGQTFALPTMNRIGILPREGNTLLTIDPQFMPESV